MRKFVILLTILVFVDICLFSQIPRPEYPRPQFERESWLNLNGEWTYSLDFGLSGFDRDFINSKGFDNKISVPFAPESKLSGVEHTDFINHIWYQRQINIPSTWTGKNILLNFGAVYYQSEVYIDGNFVGRHFGGSSSFSFDISKFVEAGKTYSLVVLASSNVRNGKQTSGKQSPRYASYLCMYTRTTGIWQTVWMEAVDPQGLKSTHVFTDIDEGQLVIHPLFYKESNNKLKVKVTDQGKTVASKETKATNNNVIVLPIKNVKTWSPENPFLYDLTYQVIDSNGNIIDEVTSYVGMRKVHIEGNRIYLNNKPYYQRLVLDQGFYPDGVWTAPSDEALKNDILLSQKAGFNGARLHQKVVEERYHYWADKLGYLTWSEGPSWGMNVTDVEAARNFLSEWRECVIRDRNHPSILTWTPMNEQWYPDKLQYPRMAEDLYEMTKQIDPTRPMANSSGGVFIKTDIWTAHTYEQNPSKLKEDLYKDGEFFANPVHIVKAYMLYSDEINDQIHYTFPVYDKKMPYLLAEFGGTRWTKEQAAQRSHSQTESWGYGDVPKTEEEFYVRLEGLVDAVLSHSEHIWGYCYTQLTDVEQEQNGIYFYDRTPKFDIKRIKQIFSKNPKEIKK